MSLLKYLLIMATGTLLSWVAWAIVLFYIDPFSTGMVGLLAFYSTFFFGVMGLLSLLGFAIRALVHRKEPLFRFIGISLRQSFWIALTVIISLILLSQDLWNVWTGGLLFLGFVILESFFLMRGKENNYEKPA